MAPIGGGPPVGSGNSFTGTAETLEIIGEHAYAYSGPFGASSNSQEVLNFQSGSFYCVGRFVFSGAFKPGTPQNGTESSMVLKFNDGTVGVLKNTGGSETGPTFSWLEVVIPPYTNVNVTVESATTDSDLLTTVSFVGKLNR